MRIFSLSYLKFPLTEMNRALIKNILKGGVS